MEKYILKKDYYGFNIDMNEEFYFDNENTVNVIINGFKNYSGINEDLTIEDIDTKKYNIYPLYATIHSCISFNTCLASKWDSGRVGNVAIKKDEPKDTIDYYIEKLDAIYNGWVYNISVLKQIVCECCNNVKEEEYEESYLCFTESEVLDAEKELKEQYNIKDLS